MRSERCTGAESTQRRGTARAVCAVTLLLGCTALAGFARAGQGPGSGLALPGGFHRLGVTSLSTPGAPAQNVKAAAIAPDGKHAYFGSAGNATIPARVVRVNLATFKADATLSLPTSVKWLGSAVMDPAGEYVYFGTSSWPGSVVKLKLDELTTGANSAASLATGALTIATVGKGDLDTAVIDPAGKFAYFARHGTVNEVIKVDLESMTKVASVQLLSNETPISGVMDPDGDYAYFGTGTNRVVRVRTNPFQRVGSISLHPSGYALTTALMDPDGEYAYFGTSEGQVVRVKIEFPVLKRVDDVSIGGNLSSAVIHHKGIFAYFGTNPKVAAAGYVLKVRVFPTLKLVESVKLLPYERELRSAVIDPFGHYAYFVPFDGRVVKLGLDHWINAPPMTEVATFGT